LSAPGATEPPATTIAERPLTEEQRIVVSRLLQRNYEALGTTFTVRLPDGSATMRAEVEWAKGRGHATVVNDGVTSELFWTGTEMLDGTIPGLAEALAASGHPSGRFVSRQVEPTYSLLDIVVSILSGLGSETRDNPVALQDQDLAYQGQRNLDGRLVDVFRFGKRTYYLVDAATGEMVGLDATLASVDGIVEVRIVANAAVTVKGPKRDEVVAGVDVADLYRNLTGKDLPGVTTPQPQGTNSTFGPPS